MDRTIITIGRDYHNDVRIDETWDTVSNRHGEISCENGQLTFTDHSSNGTVINGQKIHNTSVGIYPGDVIRLANVFELEWNVIDRFFPEIHRPTVTYNVRGKNQGAGRCTVQMNVNNSSNGRMTEQFNNSSFQQSHPVSSQDVKEYDYGKANEFSQSEIDKEIEKWNWGAFLCSWLWGVFNGIYWPLLILLVGWIPYVGQVGNLCLCAYLGLNGSKVAWRSGKYRNFERFRSAQKKWAIGGVIIFAITILGYIYILNYSLTLL
jgi:hypothetical protein